MLCLQRLDLSSEPYLLTDCLGQPLLDFLTAKFPLILKRRDSRVHRPKGLFYRRYLQLGQPVRGAEYRHLQCWVVAWRRYLEQPVSSRLC